jgi:hypothetical protein
MLAVIASGSIVPMTSGRAAAVEDRWSGRWDVEGTSTENGPFEHFGVLTLEITDFPLDHGESDACAETDVRYVGTYSYGGGGTFEACEIAELDYGLYGKYFNTNGTWGHAYMDFTPGSPATFAGYYSPPTSGTAGEPATLQWRATKLPDGCPAPEVSRTRTSVVAMQTGDDQDCLPITDVNFAFNHGGRKRSQPERVVDMTTSGTGQFTFEGTCTVPRPYSGPYKDLTVKVVRTAEIFTGDSPSVDEVKLVFRAPADGRVECVPVHRRQGGPALDIFVSLRLVRSTDPSCRARNNGRAASLFLREHDDPDEDTIGLEVAGCRLHSEEFIDGGRRKPSVKVAIDKETTVPTE